MKIKIKPLSINKAFQGRRFKTKDYLLYEQELFYLLPKIEVPNKKNLKLNIEFGINTLADIDNSLKLFLDILQKFYRFNDRYIMELNVKKVVVLKGFEYIDFNIELI